MKKKLTFFIILIFSQIFSTPTKDEFNQKFIEVAKKGNPTVVSIISETVQTSNPFYDFGGLPKEFENTC